MSCYKDLVTFTFNMENFHSELNCEASLLSVVQEDSGKKRSHKNLQGRMKQLSHSDGSTGCCLVSQLYLTLQPHGL